MSNHIILNDGISYHNISYYIISPHTMSHRTIL